jgi:hypothetical protein
MAEGVVSQRSIVAMTRVFDLFLNRQLKYAEFLYEHDFPDWFIIQATRLPRATQRIGTAGQANPSAGSRSTQSGSPL